MRWDDLNMGDKSRMIKLAVDSGITDLRTIRDVYNSYAEGGGLDENQELIDRINRTSNANFVQRLKNPNRRSIRFRNTDNTATHRMAWSTDDGGAIVYPEVQEIDGELVDMARPPYSRFAALDSAIEHGDTLRMTPKQAEWFTENYKQYYPNFADGGYIPSDSIKDYIKGSESFRGSWYTDGNGIDTVGYGFTGKKVKELYPNGMTRQQADDYFDTLVTRFAKRMEELTPNIDKLTQNQKDALFSYFYNIGEGIYSKKSPKMQKALQDMDWDTVVQNIDAGYNDEKNPGLKKRRDYERALFEQDIPRPLQPVPPAINRETFYNPTISRFNTTIPFKNGKEEVFNPFMFNLKP